MDPEEEIDLTKIDDTKQIPINQLENLTEDNVLDILEDIYGKCIVNIYVDDLLNDLETIHMIKDYQQDQKIIIINTEDAFYWCCGNNIIITHSLSS